MRSKKRPTAETVKTLGLWTLKNAKSGDIVPARDDIPGLADDTYMFFSSREDAQVAADYHRDAWEVECIPVKLS